MLKQTNKYIFLTLLIIYPAYIAISETKSNCDQNSIYIRNGNLNSALKNLHKIKIGKVYYNNDMYYKFNLITNKLQNSNKIEYLTNSTIASPNCQWVYATKYLSKTNINDYISLDLPNNRLRNPYAATLVWSPNSGKVAYILGEWVGNDDQPRNTTSSCRGSCPEKGVWIYDIDTQTKLKINITGHVLSWPAFDNNLYIDTTYKAGNIFRYHPDTGKLEQTPYKGLDFSPTGKYYLADAWDTEPAHVYQREPHKYLKEIDEKINKVGNAHGHIEWLGDGHSLIISDKQSGIKYIIYDVEKGKVTKTIDGAFLGLNKAKDRVVVMKDIDKFEVIDPFKP